jgi:hypothetical protein
MRVKIQITLEREHRLIWMPQLLVSLSNVIENGRPFVEVKRGLVEQQSFRVLPQAIEPVASYEPPVSFGLDRGARTALSKTSKLFFLSFLLARILLGFRFLVKVSSSFLFPNRFKRDLLPSNVFK